MLLSAAIIVKDQADDLDVRLASLHGLVDEIVVVDTGSSDASPLVAERHGAVLAHEPWCGDFSVPRNRSLDLAQGEWILYIDADERVRLGDHTAARAHLAAATGCVALQVRFVPRVGWTPYREFRLWRNRDDIRFRGAIHETPVPDIAAVERGFGLRVEPMDLVTIDHFGYEGDQSAKLARDEPLLLEEIARLPERTYLYDHLARIYRASGDHARAVATWEGGMVAARSHGCSRRDDCLPFANLLAHLFDVGDLDAARPVIDEAVTCFPEVPAIQLAAARLELADGDAHTARARVEGLLALDPETVIQTGSSFDPRVIGEWAWNLLGACCTALGDHAAAAHAFARAEADAPEIREYGVKRRLAEARVAQSRGAS